MRPRKFIEWPLSTPIPGATSRRPDDEGSSPTGAGWSQHAGATERRHSHHFWTRPRPKAAPTTIWPVQRGCSGCTTSRRRTCCDAATGHAPSGRQHHEPHRYSRHTPCRTSTRWQPEQQIRAQQHATVTSWSGIHSAVTRPSVDDVTAVKVRHEPTPDDASVE